MIRNFQQGFKGPGNGPFRSVFRHTAELDDILLSEITGRKTSLFSEDMDRNLTRLAAVILKSRILVIGAAGSVGSSFVKQLVSFTPRALHLIDISENNLVEVVRDIRSGNCRVPEDFRAMPVAFGSAEMEHFLDSEKPYDHILNFSAMKHVRSEKDPYSLMRMFCTNVLYVKELLEHESPRNAGTKFFSVSSDKAVRPHSVMGATKILMERVHLMYSDRIPFSSARFANVAFSDGSLLHGFRLRFDKGQPIAAPTDVRRYFISHEEAGQLCLMSCFLGENRQVFFPRLDPDTQLITFSSIAEKFLEQRGFEPLPCSSEEEAREHANVRKDGKKWPCYFFKSDTTGEKPFEEFHTEKDKVSFNRFKNIGVIDTPALRNSEKVKDGIEAMLKIRKSAQWRKEDMITAIKIAVPELDHEERNRNLDQKM